MKTRKKSSARLDREIAQALAKPTATPLTGTYFKIGDVVLMGKYKNKRGAIVGFDRDGWGNPTVEIEPIPRGRKQNKTVGLYKIWCADVKEGITGVPRKYQSPERAERAPHRRRR